jgi:transcriptional regulator with XRE-family HTH domain
MVHIGQEIRRAREERGFNQTQLAASVGTGPAAISRIENGRQSPNMDTLEKIARALELEVRDLFPKAQEPLSFEGLVDEEAREEETKQERLVQHFLARCPSADDRALFLERVVDILRYYHGLGHKMLSLMREDPTLHGTAIVWDSWYYQGLVPAIENDGAFAYADVVDGGNLNKVTRREAAACSKLIHYAIEMLNLMVDMRRVHYENNTHVNTDVGRGMEEISEYLEGIRKDVPQRGS